MPNKIGVNDSCPCGSGKKYKKCCRLNYSGLKFQVSSDKDGADMVQKYVELPDLPVNCEITIDNIGAYNYNIITRDSNPLIKYSMLTSIDPVKYPVGKNKVLDYMPDDYVSPVVITTIEGVKYKVDDLFWFPLCDVYDRILANQKRTGKRFFPVTIFIDKLTKNKTNKWISTLKNLTQSEDGSNTFINMQDLTEYAFQNMEDMKDMEGCAQS